MSFSTFLDGRPSTQLRGLAWLSLSDTGHVVRATTTDDGGGGISQVWAQAGSALPCRIDPVGSRQQGRVTGGAIDERSTHVVTVPAGTAVGAGERFAVTGRGTFEVTAVRDRTGEWSHQFEVVAT